MQWFKLVRRLTDNTTSLHFGIQYWATTIKTRANYQTFPTRVMHAVYHPLIMKRLQCKVHAYKKVQKYWNNKKSSNNNTISPVRDCELTPLHLPTPKSLFPRHLASKLWTNRHTDRRTDTSTDNKGHLKLSSVWANSTCCMLCGKLTSIRRNSRFLSGAACEPTTATAADVTPRASAMDRWILSRRRLSWTNRSCSLQTHTSPGQLSHHSCLGSAKTERRWGVALHIHW